MQVKLELDYLYNWILALAIFIRYLYRADNNEKVIENIKAKQDIDPK